MSHQVTEPPAVKRSRDSFMTVYAIMAVIFLLLALVCFFFQQYGFGIIFVLIAVMGVLALAMRLQGLRKTTVEVEREGGPSPEEVDEEDEVGRVV